MQNLNRKYRILIVDDNIIFLKALRMQILDLVPNNIELLDEAHDGLEAIENINNNHFNMVFMDIDMPLMNGVDATRYINKHFPQTYVVAISMHNEFQYIDKMLSAGCRTYISKDNLDDNSIMRVFETIENKIL